MPLRKPGDEESQQDWMKYCMGELSSPDAEDRPQEQKVAICMRAWRDRNKQEDGGDSRKGLMAILDRAAVAILEKNGYDPTQPREADSGRFAGTPRGDHQPEAFKPHHVCPRCGYRWSKTRRTR